MHASRSLFHQAGKPPIGVWSQAESAFTLIELLVVIAIIAILASMLLPVLGNANRRAFNINCTSDLRQVNLAIRMFAEDNADELPNGPDGVNSGRGLSVARSGLCLRNETHCF